MIVLMMIIPTRGMIIITLIPILPKFLFTEWFFFSLTNVCRFTFFNFINTTHNQIHQQRSPNAIPPLTNTKTQYYYKTHQSRTVSIPSNQRGPSKMYVSPDENETRSYVTKVDTTNLGSPRRQPRRHMDDDEDFDDSKNELKPFFRTGKFKFFHQKECFYLFLYNSFNLKIPQDGAKSLSVIF